jgi:hypothetical protein
MGNLRQSMTDSEWMEMELRIERDRKNGKPDDFILTLPLLNMDLDKIKELRKALEPFFQSYSLKTLDSWINWKEKEVE